MVDVEKLDSDRVLFLIWRFLLESNFRETAAKLQKEWQVPQPHRQFDFARYIKTHALVSLIHRGLQHHALEREFHQIEASHDSAADVTEDTRSFGIFGPLITEPVPTFDELEDDEDDDDTEMMDDEPESDVSRKRPGDRRRSSPAKRQRLSYGYESGGVDAATSAMELDHHENGHAYPSPLEGDQAPTPLPRTEGPAVSTQVDKVVDLSADTTFLQLQREDPNDSSAAENLPILLHCDWNPQDPTLLAAAGTDALARVWTIPSSPTDHLTQHVNAAASELIPSIADIPPHATVTAMAWNHEGGQIAVATAAGSRAQVIVSDLNSTVICDFEVPEPPIIKMKWSPNDAYILTVSPDTEGALISVLPLDRTTDPATFPLKHDLIKAEPLDASWTGDVEFIVCGGTALKSFRYTDGAISMIRKFETRDDDMLAHVQYDPTSKLIATGSDKGVVDFWDESGERRSINAHIGQITALRWQPSPADSPQDERLIATAGEDGVISIWNSRKPESKAKCSIRLELPVVALSFTPDGSFVAGATSERVYIWKTGDFVMPRAVWSRTPHPGWLSPKTPETEEEDDHCLCWDSNGQKLAYGVNSRLAIINFAASENDTPHS